MFRLMRGQRILALSALALSLWALVPIPYARADYVSQTVNLDKSNALADGVTYGSVLVEAYDGVGIGGGLSLGEVRLTYAASLVPDYASVTKTFGIGSVGFNTDLKLTAAQITGPAGWSVGNKKSLADFGSFSWDLAGNAKGGSRPNPVTVLITGLGTDATLAHFLLGSQGNGDQPPGEGSAFFAMHVAGFTVLGSGVDSHFVGGSAPPPPPGGGGDVQPTPEPSTMLLCGLGFGCLALTRYYGKISRKDASR